MQLVHTWSRRGEPSTIARTRCTFGFQRRLVRRCEWLRRLPKIGALPHTSQTDAIVFYLDSDRAFGWAAEPSLGPPRRPWDEQFRLAAHPRMPTVDRLRCGHMAALDHLGAADVRQVVTGFRDALRVHQEALNRLNVYPVPDGDTGTNMTLTLESVVQELGSARAMPEVCQAIAHGSLMGARGNSGVILSQILRGLADTFRAVEEVTAAEVTTALRTAADAAYQAVMRPVEGTILTVVRWAAEAAEGALDKGATNLVDLLDEAAAAARQAVAQTPEMLPVLRDAGVVDAGGQGFTLLLDAFLEVVDGRPIPKPAERAAPLIVEAHAAQGDISALRYEVMYLLDADDATIPAFKSAWASLGDSIVVVGGDGLWNCHVHTDDIGGAVEAGIEAGRPRNIRVTDLLEQVEEEGWVAEAAALAPIVHSPEDMVATADVAIAVGDGVRRLLASLGVQEIVAGGQSMNPSTAQILDAVERCPSDSVIVLPNNKNIV